MGTTEEAQAFIAEDTALPVDAKVGGEDSKQEETPKSAISPEVADALSKLLDERLDRKFQSFKDKGLSKLEKELAELKGRDDTGWKHGIEDSLADLLDRLDSNSDTPPTRVTRRQMLEQQRKAKEPAKTPSAEDLEAMIEQRAQIKRLNELVEESGYEPTSREIKVAKVTYTDEGYDAAVKYLKGLKKAEPTTDTAKPKFPRPSVGNTANKTWSRKMIADMSIEDYAKHRDEIEEARQKGLIKE